MGFDPLTVGLGIGAVSGIYNAVQGSKAQKKAQNVADQNYAMQQKAYDAGQQRYGELRNLILPMLNGSGYNTGQDGMMQQMRGLPTDMISSIRALSNQDLGDQLSQARGAVGSLGQRFGTAQGNVEARLRERAITGLNSQYGNLALQLGQQQQSKVLGLLSLLAGGSPQGAVPQQQFVAPQGGGFGDALGNIGNMVMLYPFLQQTMGGGGGGIGTPPIMPGGIGYGMHGGIPGSIFGGIQF